MLYAIITSNKIVHTVIKKKKVSAPEQVQDFPYMIKIPNLFGTNWYQQVLDFDYIGKIIYDQNPKLFWYQLVHTSFGF